MDWLNSSYMKFSPFRAPVEYSCYVLIQKEFCLYQDFSHSINGCPFPSFWELTFLYFSTWKLNPRVFLNHCPTLSGNKYPSLADKLHLNTGDVLLKLAVSISGRRNVQAGLDGPSFDKTVIIYLIILSNIF